MTGLRPALTAASVEPGVPVAEIAPRTRREEARAAIAVVAALRARDVPVCDIVVVARDLDAYELPLTRAALRYGIAPDCWTQIRLPRTRPYRLVQSLCTLFAVAEPDREAVFTPLVLGWSPRDPAGAWPVPAATVMQAYHDAPRTAAPVATWQALADEAGWADTRINEFLAWVASRPAPTPAAVTDVLGGVVAAYREQVLPCQMAADAPGLVETQTAGRAVVRLETLLSRAATKYEHRVRAGRAEVSWQTVAEICESLATQRPGRREHANALALDLCEANDLWARTTPYVVAVGLVAGEWPRHPESRVPPELRHAILAGDGPAACVVPRLAWTAGRDRDQFAETVSTATDGLICTRHTQDDAGIQQRRSPLLDRLDVEPVGRPARQRLMSDNEELPPAIGEMLPGNAAPCDAEVSDG